MIRIGLVQAAAVSDVPQNLKTICHFAHQAAAQECRALCFPEAFLTGYFPAQARELGLRADFTAGCVSIPSDPAALSAAEYFQEISALACQLKLDLLVGFMERFQERCYLTHGIFTSGGQRFFYRKTHLGQREQAVFSAGNALDVYPLSCGLNVGISLCCENHFPEVSQTLSLKGADIIFAPHASPRVSGNRKTVWARFIPARSYDNRLYMACCNQQDQERFGGGCLVTDPQGDVIASCFEEKPALICFDVDPKEVRRYRDPDSGMKYRYYPGLRRPELYEV